MSTTIAWREERVTAAETANRIIAAAKVANRDLTPAEVDTLTKSLALMKDLGSKIKGRELVNSVMSLGSAEDDPDRPGLFTELDKTGIVQAIKSRTAFRTTVPSKALIGETGLLPASGTGVVRGLHPGGMFALASLFANEPASGPSIRYYVMDSAAAAVVAEGGLKPDAGLAITPRDAVLVKLATVSKISDELQSDAPYIITAIAQELQAAVNVAENNHVIATLTAASGVLTDTSTEAELLDVFADQIAAQTSLHGLVPSAIVVAPSVLSSLRKARGVPTGNYLIDPLSAAPASVHGVPLVSTASTAAGTAWVITGRAATMFRRGPVQIEVGLSGDDFERNQTHLRCEERVVLAVQRPSMVSKITITG